MSETVNIWIERFQNENRDVVTEIDETRGAIENERLWQKGCDTAEQIETHEQNIADLTEYLEWLESQTK